MAHRAVLPPQAVTITPGYSWRLDLDVKFDGERPSDWPLWTVRMHIWAGAERLTLVNNAGVTFESIEDLPGETSPVTIPVIQMTGAQTAAFSASGTIQYVIDMQAPTGDAEDYFAGTFTKVFGPPLEMLT